MSWLFSGIVLLCFHTLSAVRLMPLTRNPCLGLRVFLHLHCSTVSSQNFFFLVCLLLPTGTPVRVLPTQAFSRFYFVGDEDLLEIVGNANEPAKVAQHLGKMFASVGALNMPSGQQPETSTKTGQHLSLLLACKVNSKHHPLTLCFGAK